MWSKRIRVKLILILALLASAAGAEFGRPTEACSNARCAALFSDGKHMGYGCITGGTGNCSASQTGCTSPPC